MEKYNGIYEEKRRFVEELEKVIKTDDRADIESIAYRFNNADEWVEITFVGGSMKVGVVTFDSCGAIFKCIGAIVYGEGAPCGLITDNLEAKDFVSKRNFRTEKTEG